MFISHDHDDQTFAESVVDLLVHVLKLDLDANEIRCSSVEGCKHPIGAKNSDVLRDEIENAKAFILLLTPRSVQSAWVMIEAGAAWGRKRPLFIVGGGGVVAADLPDPLHDYFGLFNHTDDEFRNFLQGVGRVLGDRRVGDTVTYKRQVKAVADEAMRIVVPQKHPDMVDADATPLPPLMADVEAMLDGPLQRSVEIKCTIRAARSGFERHLYREDWQENSASAPLATIFHTTVERLLRTGTVSGLAGELAEMIADGVVRAGKKPIEVHVRLETIGKIVFQLEKLGLMAPEKPGSPRYHLSSLGREVYRLLETDSPSEEE